MIETRRSDVPRQVVDACVGRIGEASSDPMALFVARLGGDRMWREAEVLWRNNAYASAVEGSAQTGDPLLHGPRDGADRMEASSKIGDFAPYRVELVLSHAGEAPRWLELRAQPLQRLTQRATLYLAAVRDVTDDKRREAALREALSTAAVAAEAAMTMASQLQVFDAETLRFVRLNETARRALGLGRAEIGAHGPLSFWNDLDAAQLRDRLEPAIVGARRPPPMMLRQREADGAVRARRAQLSAFTVGDRVLAAVVLDGADGDVQPVRPGGEQGAPDERLDDGRWSLDADGLTLRLCRRLAARHPGRGTSPAADEGRDTTLAAFLAAAAHHEDHEAMVAALDRCRVDGARVDATVRLSVEGRWRAFRMRGERVQAGDQRVRGVVYDIHDVVAERDAAIGEARARSGFLARMSHEIRTPLNGVLGMAEVLRAAEADPAARARLEVILSSGRSLISIIDDIMTLATETVRGGAGQSQVFALAQLCEAALDPVRAQAADKGLRLEVDAAPGLWRGEAKRITHVLINLLGNAVKFTTAGSVRVAAEPCAGGLRFTVDDTGPGVAPGDRRRIFEPFERAAGGGGHGLGLAVAREFVAAMDGRIGVADADVGGARFWFSCRAELVDDGV